MKFQAPLLGLCGLAHFNLHHDVLKGGHNVIIWHVIDMQAPGTGRTHYVLVKLYKSKWNMSCGFNHRYCELWPSVWDPRAHLVFSANIAAWEFKCKRVDFALNFPRHTMTLSLLLDMPALGIIDQEYTTSMWAHLTNWTKIFLLIQKFTLPEAVKCLAPWKLHCHNIE